jgi:esterase
MPEPALDDLAHYRLATEIAGMDVPELRLPEHGQVLVGRMRLHYLDWGTAGRLPIVFLHGGGLTAHTWDLVCLALRAEHHCLALDQRGHGDSEWSPELDYAPGAHLRDLEGFIDQLRLERFVLVGQSMGALNAFVYATRHAARLMGLVLIDAGPRVREAGTQRIADFLHDTAEAESIDDLVEKALLFNPHRDRRLLRWSLRRNFRRLPNGRWTRKTDLRWLHRDAREMAARFREAWHGESSVTCPTLVVRGGSSDVFANEDAAGFAAALPHGRWVTVEGAGHTVQGDEPRRLCDVLRAFLAAAPR